jgi:hypothetical protein
MLSIPANGTQNGLLRVANPVGDANKTVTTGNVVIYEASKFGRYPDGSGNMPLLWKSPTYVYNKFDTVSSLVSRCTFPPMTGEWIYGLPGSSGSSRRPVGSGKHGTEDVCRHCFQQNLRYNLSQSEVCNLVRLPVFQERFPDSTEGKITTGGRIIPKS